MENLLSIITFLPLVAALILAFFLRGDDAAAQRNAKWLALIATSATFLVSLFLLAGFDPRDTGFQFVEERPWILGLTYKVGVDGISILFVMLTTFLMPLVIASAWDVTHRVKEYMIAFLMLETLMIGVFVALDLVLFYLFFEAGLIPMFLIIGIWGGKERIYASFKFFLYTFLGSVLMLVAMIAMYVDAGTTDITRLLNHQFGSGTISVAGVQVVGGLQTLLWLAFFASFAVKMPMWPVHTWLPDAHVQAPTAGSVVLAAILLKMGGYGFLRFSLPMFPVASDLLAPLVLWLSAIAIVYTSFVAIAQSDMKKLIAYSSVAHMGFVTAGIFAVNQQGLDGAIFQMISHGFISGALFLCVGVIYDRMHTREIDAYGGLVNRMPAYALVFMLFTMANVGLPGTSGLRGRVPDAHGHVPGQHMGGGRGGDGRDPVGRLCALALPAGGPGRPHQGEPEVDLRHDAPRAGDLRAAHRDDDPARRLPEPRHRHHRPLRGRADPELRHRAARGRNLPLRGERRVIP
jgi:NADH-quinone oxidoreductase subunit M